MQKNSFQIRTKLYQKVNYDKNKPLVKLNKGGCPGEQLDARDS